MKTPILVISILAIVSLVVTFIGWSLFLGGGLGSGIIQGFGENLQNPGNGLNYASGVVISWPILVALQMGLMTAVLVLVMCCYGHRDEGANPLIIVIICLIWVAIGILEFYIEGVALYLGFGIYAAIIALATFNVNYHLLNLFCAGTVITGITMIPSSVLLLIASIMYCCQSSPEQAAPLPVANTVPTTTYMTTVTNQPYHMPLQQVPYTGYSMPGPTVPVDQKLLVPPTDNEKADEA